jgi:hypothetical protein
MRKTPLPLLQQTLHGALDLHLVGITPLDHSDVNTMRAENEMDLFAGRKLRQARVDVRGK